MRRFANLSVRQKIAASTFVVIAFITAVSWLSIQLIVFPNLTRQIVSRASLSREHRRPRPALPHSKR